MLLNIVAVISKSPLLTKMEAAKEAFQHGLQAFRGVPLSLRIAGFTGGFILAGYGAYYVWFFGGTRRVKSHVSLEGKTVIITGENDCGKS